MVKFANLDERIGIVDQLDQLGESVSPVVLVNVFTVDSREAEDVIAASTTDAEFMKRQPGFIWTQLHRGIGGSSTFLNYAVWESVAAFRAAFEHPEFQGKIDAYPPSAVSQPHLFRKVAIPGICVVG